MQEEKQMTSEELNEMERSMDQVVEEVTNSFTNEIENNVPADQGRLWIFVLFFLEKLVFALFHVFNCDFR